MRVLISGANGFIGTGLRGLLEEEGHEPFPLRRGHPSTGARTWSIAEQRIDDDALEGIEAVVHLSGRPIAPPFTAERKREIEESRVISTSLMAEAVAAHQPDVFICASAIGYYGDRGDEVLTEESPPGTGFLARVATKWEAACDPARQAGVRTVNIRTALVLDQRGGLLSRIALPFRLGLGGPLGDGQQWWSWITLEDEVRAILHCLSDSSIEGPVNLAAPEPVRNREFVKMLGSVLHRPALIPVPPIMLELALGREAAHELVLASQRVVPAKLTDTGFEFRSRTLRRGLLAALE